jgi:hypothetical protein
MTNLTKKAFGHFGVVSDLGLSHNRFNNISLNAFEGFLHLQEGGRRRTSLTSKILKIEV